MAPHSSTLAWKIPWMEESPMETGVGCSPWGCQESDTTERLPFHFSLSCIGEGNDNPLQCSCLENPRDRGTWWASVYGVAQSWTQLKRLSSSSSVFLTPLLYSFCFCQVHTISVLYCAHLCMKYSLGTSNFLEEISSLSDSIFFLYFLLLWTIQNLTALVCPGSLLECRIPGPSNTY